jgi:hypothetical protein
MMKDEFHFLYTSTSLFWEETAFETGVWNAEVWSRDNDFGFEVDANWNFTSFNEELTEVFELLRSVYAILTVPSEKSEIPSVTRFEPSLDMIKWAWQKQKLVGLPESFSDDVFVDSVTDFDMIVGCTLCAILIRLGNKMAETNFWFYWNWLTNWGILTSNTRFHQAKSLFGEHQTFKRNMKLLTGPAVDVKFEWQKLSHPPSGTGSRL